MPTYPALVPLTGSNPAHRALAGVSVQARVWVADEGRRTKTKTLSRHSSASMVVVLRPPSRLTAASSSPTAGHSGPAVLNVSHAVTRADGRRRCEPVILVQWTDLDAAAWDALLRAGSGPALPLLRRHLPERLAAQLLAETGLDQADLSQLRREERARLVDVLTRYPLPWAGSEGYKTAEVTGGGVSLARSTRRRWKAASRPASISAASCSTPFGPIGGYNFLWAWVTGRIAGLAAGGRDA